MTDDIKAKISDLVNNNKVFLFMKGTPDAPMCGFSSQTSMIVKSYNVEFGSFDILSDQDIRNGIKEYSDWPTIPQLYVNGEFVGGCDICSEMHNSGDLKALIEA
ncbi:MAG: monothiol glutaredoxin [Lysobacterales bacterium]|jgi:monothiol glutaredoxin